MSKKTPSLVVVGGVIGLVASILALTLAVLAFVGIVRLDQLLARSEAKIAESAYSTVSPECDHAKDPPDLSWDEIGVQATCLAADTGTSLQQKDPAYIGQLELRASSGHAFEVDHTVNVGISALKASTTGDTACAGIVTRVAKGQARGYGFFTCGVTGQADAG